MGFVHSNIQEGMESVSMSHLVHPPYTPISPLPDPRDQTASSVRHNSQSLTMAAESARIQKELADPEEDQLPQCGRERQPDGDEARPPGDRAEDDRERDSRSAERDLSEPIVPTRGHPRRDIHRVHLLVNVRLDAFSRKKRRKKSKGKSKSLFMQLIFI